MNTNDVMKELSGLSVEEMTSRYTKSRLQFFFRALYGIKPRECTKADLAYKCWYFIEDYKRTEDLCKILRF